MIDVTWSFDPRVKEKDHNTVKRYTDLKNKIKKSLSSAKVSFVPVVTEVAGNGRTLTTTTTTTKNCGQLYNLVHWVWTAFK